MSLKEQLDKVKESFIASAPEEAQTEVFRLIREQQESGIPFGLKAGDKAPDFTLANPLGKPVTLYDELSKGPVVLTFYRGGWCPFCSLQLRSYQQLLPEIEKLGGRLIAVSPQSPDNSLSQQEKEELTFQVLSDPNGQTAENFGVLYELPESLQQIFSGTLGLDLTVFNASNRWVLPIPATFIIGRDGIVRRAHVDPDFTVRLDPQEIVHELKSLQA
ncbi:peroxiredoxin-like family protein [Paenibacillus humicola]|uniref:peroxiredoxin-like family protein n=1 Tax=Paenibacillus humicola TaxID=3110540 RepID=UPI00237BA611|nr:peroxiredoxin-like family protein [Paenibacillus humicola]